MKRTIYLLLATLLISQAASAQLSFTTLNSATATNLLSISFADTATGYACGDGGVILKTSNGGVSWTPLSSGTANNLWDIKVIPQSGGQKLLAVGDNKTILKSVDAGLSWTPQASPFTNGSFVFGISCLDSSNYFICGGDITTFIGAVLKTTNGGDTWTMVTVAGSVFLDKIFMLDGATGFTAGTGATFMAGAVYKTTDGASWPAVKTTSDILTNVWCNGPNDIVSVGLGGQIWKSTDGGTDWASKSFNATDLYGIVFKDAQHGYACGGSNAGSVILSTADGGDTWAQEDYFFNGALQSACVVGNKLFMAGDGGRIIKADIADAASVSPANLPPSAGIRVYPNPATEKLTIANPTHLENLSIRLMNLSGSIVAERAVSQAGSELPVHDLAQGIYRYELMQGKTSIASGRLVIR